MKVLLVAPEVRMDSTPTVWPFWAGIFAAIVEKKGGQVGIETWTLVELNSKNNIWLKSISWKW